MTPMIDVVFQLLAFFMMTFKISGAEGDFNIKMPLAQARGVPDPTQAIPLKITLRADADGTLSGISAADRTFKSFKDLHEYVIGYIGDDRGPGSLQQTAEAELDCDYQLKYDNVVKAITAVSGYVDADGRVVKLIEKIKFSPPKAGP
jgi:biopolymer transport protein ExbD